MILIDDVGEYRPIKLVSVGALKKGKIRPVSRFSGDVYVDVRKYPRFEGMALGRVLSVRLGAADGTLTYADAEVIDVDVNGFVVRLK
jgi:hypothetical protein